MGDNATVNARQLQSPSEVAYYSDPHNQVFLTGRGLTVGHAFYPFDQISSVTRRRIAYARRTPRWWLGLALIPIGLAISLLLLQTVGFSELAIWLGIAISAIGYLIWWRQATFTVRVTGTFGSLNVLNSPTPAEVDNFVRIFKAARTNWLVLRDLPDSGGTSSAGWGPPTLSGDVRFSIFRRFAARPRPDWHLAVWWALATCVATLPCWLALLGAWVIDNGWLVSVAMVLQGLLIALCQAIVVERYLGLPLRIAFDPQPWWSALLSGPGFFLPMLLGFLLFEPLLLSSLPAQVLLLLVSTAVAGILYGRGQSAILSLYLPGTKLWAGTTALIWCLGALSGVLGGLLIYPLIPMENRIYEPFFALRPEIFTLGAGIGVSTIVVAALSGIALLLSARAAWASAQR